MYSEKENGLSVSFYTLGCRLNVFESDGLASILKKDNKIIYSSL